MSRHSKSDLRRTRVVAFLIADLLCKPRRGSPHESHPQPHLCTSLDAVQGGAATDLAWVARHQWPPRVQRKVAAADAPSAARRCVGTLAIRPRELAQVARGPRPPARSSCDTRRTDKDARA